MDTAIKTDTVKLTVNGTLLEAAKGARLLDVLLQNHVAVPHLCYFERLSPFAGCRTCVVEIEGVRGTPVSCTATVTEGMVVRTESETLDAIRHGVMEYILCDHPGRCFDCHRLEHCGPGLICLRDEVVTERCLTCAKNRFCELQEVAEHINMRGRELYYTEKQTWYGETNDREVMRIIRTNPFIELEFDKCIVCTRCVRVCDEVRGRGVFTLSYKGPQAKIDTMFGVPLQDTDCEFCGACVDVCPTAAIMDKTTKWVGIPDQTVETICTHCSVGCGLKMGVKNGKLAGTFPDFDNPSNNGQICARGRYGHDYVQNNERLTTPWIRQAGVLVPASWEEAMGLITEKLAGVEGDRFGLVASASLANEDLYAARVFATRVMGSANLDHGTSLLAQATLGAMEDRLGYGAAATNSWDDLSEAQAILIIDADVTKTHPVAGVEILEAVRRKNGHLIVASSTELEVVNLAGGLALDLRIRAGGEQQLLAGLLLATAEAGATLPGEVRDSLSGTTIETAADACGINPADLRRAGVILAASSATAIVFPAALPWLGGQKSVDVLITLALATKTLGVAGGGLYGLLPEGNSQGAFDLGVTPAAGGKGAGAILEGMADGSLAAAWFVGYDPLAGGNAGLAAQAMASSAFVVVQDISLTRTAALADVVLPGTAGPEKTGSVTNNERRVQRLQTVVLAPGDAIADWAIFSRAAAALGKTDLNWASVDDVTADMMADVPAYAGISAAVLLEGSVVWPYDAEASRGSQLLYAGGLAAGKGQARAIQLAPADPDRLWIQPLVAGAPVAGGGLFQREFVELSAADAERFGVRDGELAILAGAGGSVTATVRVSRRALGGVGRVSGLMPATAAALRLAEGGGPVRVTAG